jgi:hypothetical protein
MNRVIISLETKKGVVYKVGQQDGDYLIKQIEFKRDGLLSINHGDGSRSHYLLTFVDPTDKAVLYKVLPYDTMESLVFIVEKTKDDKSYETSTDIRKVT